MIVISLEASKKLYELLGDTYETRFKWYHPWLTTGVPEIRLSGKVPKIINYLFGDVPAPVFSELLRLLPKIGEAKGWEYEEGCLGQEIQLLCECISEIWMLAPTEEEGISEVGEYLLKYTFNKKTEKYGSCFRQGMGKEE